MLKTSTGVKSKTFTAAISSGNSLILSVDFGSGSYEARGDI